MATSSNNQCNDASDRNLTLHEMFSVIGDQLLPRDVRVLKFLYTGVFSDELRAKINDGYTFFLALERIGRVDTSNFKYIINLLRIIVRQDLIPLVTLRRRKTVEPDPVDVYLEETARISTSKRKCPFTSPHREGNPNTSSHSCESRASTSSPTTLPQKSPDCCLPAAKRRRSGRRRSPPSATVTTAADSSPSSPSEVGSSTIIPQPATLKSSTSEPTQHQEIRKKVTCDIRLRVRAEYCHHDSALQGNVFSNKPELLERQFEKFMQANTILKSRDLGSIICDIKFSELTYLDAFWRDYINGSLLEALKGVFITESLKQAVGHEAIKLLVNVDEDDYEAGRKQLLQNLRE